MVFGIACLAVSLAIKPHDSGFVWLYFLLVGGVHRKRALQTLLVVAAAAIPAFLWVTHIAPHWLNELQTNLSITSAHGGNGDPGPAGGLGVSPGMIIDLQTIFSVLRDDPHFYNPITYLVCGPMLVAWVIVTIRSRFSPTNAWLALASISALSMLPLYHRPHDAKLLVLTIPACALLVAEGGRIGRIALLLNAAAILIRFRHSIGSPGAVHEPFAPYYRGIYRESGGYPPRPTHTARAPGLKQLLPVGIHKTWFASYLACLGRSLPCYERACGFRVIDMF